MAPRIITITLEQQGIERNPPTRPQCCYTSRNPNIKWRKRELRRLRLPLSSQQMIQCPVESTRTIYGQPYCSNHRPNANKRSTRKPRFEVDPYYDTTEWRILRFDVLIRDKHICQYCGEPARQADHVIPRKAGGYDLMDNLVAACASCNRIAGNNQFPTFDEKKRWILTHRKKFLNDRRPTELLDRINREVV